MLNGGGEAWFVVAKSRKLVSDAGQFSIYKLVHTSLPPSYSARNSNNIRFATATTSGCRQHKIFLLAPSTIKKFRFCPTIFTVSQSNQYTKSNEVVPLSVCLSQSRHMIGCYYFLQPDWMKPSQRRKIGGYRVHPTGKRVRLAHGHLGLTNVSAVHRQVVEAVGVPFFMRLLHS